MGIKNSIFTLSRFLKKQFSLKADVKAESGIGVLIIFIALVLVAAVAASVLIHTAGILQQKASATGTTTINQVSTGLVISQILGYDGASPPEAGGIQFLAIFVTDNSGGNSINMANVTLTLTLHGVTAVLVYNNSIFESVSQSGTSSVFGSTVWNNLSASHNNPNNFGIFVISDPSHSLNAKYPVLSPGSQAAIILNVTNTFGTNLTQNTHVSGQITPQIGIPALVNFVAPEAFLNHAMTLQ
jgi:flagellin FlaB